MARRKVGREKESQRQPVDLETLLRMSYEFMTTKFLILAGYPEKEAEELYERYRKYRERIDGVEEAISKAADAFKNMKAVEIR